MRFKLDENVPRRAAELLADEGHQVSTVKDEGLVGGTDATIVKAASEENLVLVSLDKDLGDLRTFPPGTHPGIIVLRLSDQSPDSVVNVLGSFLARFNAEDVSGCLVVLDAARVRIRRP